MATVETCVNHPRVETRVSCSTCDAPICPACMRQSAVGQKCPDCARIPRSSRALGKPAHYVRAVGAGLGVALVGGLLVAEVAATVRFGSLILAGALGYFVGRTVHWGAQRQSQPPFPAIAASCAVLGVAVGLALVRGTPVPANPFLLLGYAVAAWLAVRGAQG